MEYLKEFDLSNKEQVTKLLTYGFKRYAGLSLAYMNTETIKFDGENLLCYNYSDSNKKAVIRIGFSTSPEVTLKIISLIQDKKVLTRKIKNSDKIIPIIKLVPEYIIQNKSIENTSQDSDPGKPVLTSEESKAQQSLKDIARAKQYVKKKNEILRRTIQKIENLRLVLVTGSSGTGKTFTTTNTLQNDLGMIEGKDFALEGGGEITPAKLYSLLSQYHTYGKVTVIDEANATMDIEENSNMFKMALQPNGKLSRGGKSLPFRGAVVMITNKSPQWVAKKLGMAVMGRASIINFEATNEDIEVYIEELLPTLQPQLSLTREQKKECFDFFIENYPRFLITKLETEGGISIRTLERVMTYYELYPKMWKEQSLATL